MMRLALALALAPVGAALAASSDNVFDVTEYGAVGDGATDNTVAFRNATTAAAVAATADTPTVLFVPHGNFMTGAFNLSSHVTLELSGADSSIVGLATTSEIAFPVVPPLPSYGKARDGQPARYQALIMATDATNVAINGNGGLIDGGGSFWWKIKKTVKYERPHLVEFYNTSNFEISNVTLKDSGFWTTHPVYSSNGWIHHVNITAPATSPNTDGIDPDSSQNILIEDSVISCGDDAIAVKSGMDKPGIEVGIPTRNITVRNCQFLAGRGISIGSEVSGGVEDVLFQNISLVGPTEHGLHIKTSATRGGYVRNIVYEDIRLGEVTGDALLTIMTDYGSSSPGSEDTLTDISNISWRNISRIGNFPTLKGAGSFQCFSDAHCKSISVEDVHLEPLLGRSTWECSNVDDGSVKDVSPSGLSDCFKG